jgi:hypothetical protein
MRKDSKLTISKQKTIPDDNKPSIGPTILENVVTSMTFGTGSSLGHRAVDGVMDNREVYVPYMKQNEINQGKELSCKKLLEVYKICTEDDSNCKYWEDLIKLKCD